MLKRRRETDIKKLNLQFQNYRLKLQISSENNLDFRWDLIIRSSTPHSINTMGCCQHLFLSLVHLKTERNKMFLDIRNIIENKALFKSMRLVTNGTFHTIRERGDVLGNFAETGLIHVHMHALMLLETIGGYKRGKRIMYINLNPIDTMCCCLLLLLLLG